MKFLKIVLTIMALMLTYISLSTATASAQDAVCSESAPSYPGYNSAVVQIAVYPDDQQLLPIPVRRGFYCKKAGESEVTGGLGFGYDKAWHRHNITSLHAIKFALQAEYYFQVASDIGGIGYNFVSYARKKRCNESGTRCQVDAEQKVVAATTTGSSDFYHGMPAGSPVGLVTAYCDFGDPTQLRCQDWVDWALSGGKIGTP